MSAYIVNDETITVIAKGFVDYGVEFKADDYVKTVRVLVDFKAEVEEIGQSLLNQNYVSINCRYRENNEIPKFKSKEVEYNEGILLGCIDCYIYQACETEDFFESELYYSLIHLKDAMLKRFIKAKGQDIPWGYEF